MNYELTDILEKAGFPVKYSQNRDLRLYPTLSELIEACLDFYHPCSFEMGGENTWWAILRGKGNKRALVPVQVGSTPEEAVANLWLALNKK